VKNEKMPENGFEKLVSLFAWFCD